MVGCRKVDLDAEIKGDNLVPQKCKKKLGYLSRCVNVLLIGFQANNIRKSHLL